MSNKAIVHLRVYYSNGRDTNLNYDENGNVQNDNVLVKLTYRDLEWGRYIKNIKPQGLVKAKVEKIVGSDIDITTIQSEVDKAMNPQPEKALTPDQKKIAELEAKINAMLNKGAKTDHIEDAQIVDEDELSKARAEYQKVFSEKGHHTWSVEQIKEKIANELKTA